MAILDVEKISDLTSEVLEKYRFSKGDNGIIISMIPGDVEILGAGQWLVPVRCFPEYGEKASSFLDFIPHGYENWADEFYPYEVPEYGAWF